MNKFLRTFTFFFLSLLAILALNSKASAAPFPAPQAPAAPGRAECRTLPSKILGRPVAYCVILPRDYDQDTTTKYPVLYFLHGLGGNEQQLVRQGVTDEVDDLRAANKIGEFLLVSPNAGRSFYINSRNGKIRYEDFFIKDLIPFIESHYRVNAVRQGRGISGVSMGGYGALRFGLKYPELFGSVSAHSAALIDKLPKYKPTEEQADEIAIMVGNSFGDPVDPAFWEKESPFTIVRNSPKPTNLPIYFDCGTDDEFGFYRGAAHFDELLTSRGIPHEFHLYPGGHDLDYFSEHLPASLEFHSRVFAGKTSAR